MFHVARLCVRLLSPNELLCMQSTTCFLARYRVRPTVIFGSIVAQMTPRGQISGLLIGFLVSRGRSFIVAALAGGNSRFVLRVEDGNSDSSVRCFFYSFSCSIRP